MGADPGLSLTLADASSKKLRAVRHGALGHRKDDMSVGIVKSGDEYFRADGADLLRRKIHDAHDLAPEQLEMMRHMLLAMDPLFLPTVLLVALVGVRVIGVRLGWWRATLIAWLGLATSGLFLSTLTGRAELPPTALVVGVGPAGRSVTPALADANVPVTVSTSPCLTVSGLGRPVFQSLMG